MIQLHFPKVHEGHHLPNACRGKRKVDRSASFQFFQKKFASGDFAATDMVEASTALCEDVGPAAPAQVKELQDVKLDGHTYRGVMRRMDKCGAPEVYQTYVPGWDPHTNPKKTGC